MIKPMAVLLPPTRPGCTSARAAGSRSSRLTLRLRPFLDSVTVGKCPWGITLWPDAKTLYSANGPSNSISVVNLADDTVAATIPGGTGPCGVIVLPR